MFEKKTLFIVGAGGSKELGLPVGDELKSKISEMLNISDEHVYRQSKGHPEIVQTVRHIIRDAEDNNPSPYYQAGRLIAAAMPQAISIDNFMHTHNLNALVGIMGKIGIAKCILDAERKSKIYAENNSYQRLNFENLKESWHTVFCKMLTEDVTKDSVEQIFENVSFISFNYDRCIEHYLSQAIANYFDIATNEAEKIVTGMAIVHPYGQVGNLPWQSSPSTRYGQEPNPFTLYEVAKQIRTFTERSDDDEMMDRMRDLIREARVIVYLGFSFGDMNMKLLKCNKNNSVKVFGTSLGMSEPNTDVAVNDARKAMGLTKTTHVELVPENCHDFLNAYLKPILRG